LEQNLLVSAAKLLASSAKLEAVATVVVVPLTYSASMLELPSVFFLLISPLLSCLL